MPTRFLSHPGASSGASNAFLPWVPGQGLAAFEGVSPRFRATVVFGWPRDFLPACQKENEPERFQEVRRALLPAVGGIFFQRPAFSGGGLQAGDRTGVTRSVKACFFLLGEATAAFTDRFARLALWSGILRLATRIRQGPGEKGSAIVPLPLGPFVRARGSCVARVEKARKAALQAIGRGYACCRCGRNTLIVAYALAGSDESSLEVIVISWLAPSQLREGLCRQKYLKRRILGNGIPGHPCAWRGERPSRSCRGPRAGAIPACAGGTTATFMQATQGRGHPCACRENRKSTEVVINKVGTSLRVQGEPPRLCCVSWPFRDIPARAGRTHY